MRLTERRLIDARPSTLTLAWQRNDVYANTIPSLRLVQIFGRRANLRDALETAGRSTRCLDFVCARESPRTSRWSISRPHAPHGGGSSRSLVFLRARSHGVKFARVFRRAFKCRSESEDPRSCGTHHCQRESDARALVRVFADTFTHRCRDTR